MKDLQGNEINLGPVTPEESNLLTAITRMVAAENILEFGYQTGRSAKAFLDGMKSNGRLISLDIEDRSEKRIPDDRLTLVKADMTMLNTTMLPQGIDIVFFDASHLLEDNLKAFKLVEPFLKSKALVIVHDTGYWDTTLYTEIPWELNGIVPHRPGEIAFVNYLQYNFGYNTINFGTTKEFRCGLTVLQ